MQINVFDVKSEIASHAYISNWPENSIMIVQPNLCTQYIMQYLLENEFKRMR